MSLVQLKKNKSKSYVNVFVQCDLFNKMQRLKTYLKSYSELSKHDDLKMWNRQSFGGFVFSRKKPLMLGSLFHLDISAPGFNTLLWSPPPPTSTSKLKEYEQWIVRKYLLLLNVYTVETLTGYQKSSPISHDLTKTIVNTCIYLELDKNYKRLKKKTRKNVQCFQFKIFRTIYIN